MQNRFSLCLCMMSLSVIVLLFVPSPLSAQEDVGYLRTRIKPSVAGVFVDGKYQGTVSMFQSRSRAIRVPVGEHEVKIVDPRYKELTQTVNIEAGKTVTLRQSLEPISLARPPFGVLKTKNAGRSAVYINGKYYGHADEFNGPGQGLLLNPGEYNLRIVPLAGGSPHEEKIKIDANRTTVVRLP